MFSNIQNISVVKICHKSICWMYKICCEFSTESLKVIILPKNCPRTIFHCKMTTSPIFGLRFRNRYYYRNKKFAARFEHRRQSFSLTSHCRTMTSGRSLRKEVLPYFLIKDSLWCWSTCTLWTGPQMLFVLEIYYKYKYIFFFLMLICLIYNNSKFSCESPNWQYCQDTTAPL